ncbi:MAG: hypothetical protein QM780_06750 [Hyphomicrobium sp.]|uniref:hypothetical protein n=1 Tax=Hyphomicrobium sp. TaxID=82 RepID=UPI0039E34848
MSSNALLLHAATALIGELKKRLSYCFTVTMVEDVYLTWGPVGESKWDFRAPVASWEIKNVAEQQKLKALKLLDGFEQTYGCSLASFVEVAFSPDKKRRTGPLPSPHTKVERTARQFKALGYPKLTPAVIRQYLSLLTDYRADLLPPTDPGEDNIVPFKPKT